MSEERDFALAWGALLRFAACALGFMAAAVLTQRLAGVDVGTADIEAKVLLWGAGCAGFLAVAAYLPPSARLRPPRGLLRAVLSYAGFFLLVWIPFTLLLYPTVVRWLQLEFEPQPHLAYFQDADPGRWQFVGVVLTIVVVGPLMEEVAFRGFVRDLLRGLVGPAAGLFGTAVLFGLIHVRDGFALALPMALLGVLFGWLRERTGGLAAPLLAHALHNAIAVGVTMALPEVLDEVFR